MIVAYLLNYIKAFKRDLKNTFIQEALCS